MLCSIYVRNGLTTAYECDYMRKKLYGIKRNKKVIVDGDKKQVTVFTGNATNGILQLEVLVCFCVLFVKMCNKHLEPFPLLRTLTLWRRNFLLNFSTLCI
jgi:hypothetical protein